MRTHWILTMAMLSAASLPAAAQTGVTGARPLAFGTLLPGIAATVLPTDPANSGEFTLTGRNNEQISLAFSLPASMTGPGGATLPLTFGGSSAGYSLTSSTSDETLFSPSAGLQTRLSHGSGTGTAAVFLGATANPSTGQRAGSYLATVTLSVVFF